MDNQKVKISVKKKKNPPRAQIFLYFRYEADSFLIFLAILREQYNQG